MQQKRGGGAFKARNSNYQNVDIKIPNKMDSELWQVDLNSLTATQKTGLAILKVANAAKGSYRDQHVRYLQMLNLYTGLCMCVYRCMHIPISVCIILCRYAHLQCISSSTKFYVTYTCKLTHVYIRAHRHTLLNLDAHTHTYISTHH